MKKLLVVSAAVCCVLALAACGGNDTPVGDVSSDSQQDPQTQSVDLKQTAADAVAALGDEYPMFPVKDTAELESLYPGLTAVETKQLVAYQPPVSGFGCELAMVEVADAADAETVRAISSSGWTASPTTTPIPRTPQPGRTIPPSPSTATTLSWASCRRAPTFPPPSRRSSEEAGRHAKMPVIHWDGWHFFIPLPAA